MKVEINRKDQELLELRQALVDLCIMLDQPEQHARRNSLGGSGCSGSEGHDAAASLGVCGAMENGPPAQQRDAVVSQRSGHNASGKSGQIFLT